MSDLYGWIVEQIGGKEELARMRSGERPWWEPWVLRRCAADRKLLTVHGPRGGDWNPWACEGCGYDGSNCPELVTGHANDCPVLLAVAEGYGLTEEILAGLDRPEWKPPERPGQSMMPKALQEAYGDAIMRSLTRHPASIHRNTPAPDGHAVGEGR